MAFKFSKGTEKAIDKDGKTYDKPVYYESKHGNTSTKTPGVFFMEKDLHQKVRSIKMGDHAEDERQGTHRVFYFLDD